MRDDMQRKRQTGRHADRQTYTQTARWTKQTAKGKQETTNKAKKKKQTRVEQTKNEDTCLTQCVLLFLSRV